MEHCNSIRPLTMIFEKLHQVVTVKQYARARVPLATPTSAPSLAEYFAYFSNVEYLSYSFLRSRMVPDRNRYNLLE